MTGSIGHHHYNPDWLSDDALVANFVARVEEFSFLRDELAHMPTEGTVQHYLLVGLRGAGKTTLLKRLAVAIRRDTDLNDHLIALSFPEELYQVKDLEDFWWAACDALVDELESLNLQSQASKLITNIEKIKEKEINSKSAAFDLLLKTCKEMQRRPVLLVDNLDMVFQRIDKKGRKLKDPYAAAYWELREILSTTSAPIVIGGSVRLSEPFIDYDKAFYDFFIPKRLGKMKLDEVRLVIDRLADAQGVPEVKQRLRDRPSRIESLYELTGGNPRALGLIFELLRQGPNSRAVEDFERLMDITTPYFKARFEDLSEQAQIVMHALAVRRFDSSGSNLRFGHTASEISKFSRMKTSSVSAQLEIMTIEGLVEKTASYGKTQYRIAEQMFRLWLQMRSTKRIRQNVIGLTEFLEAMFDLDELQANIKSNDMNPLAEAKYSFAVADSQCPAELKNGLEIHGADQLFEHLRTKGGKLEDYFPKGELSKNLEHIVLMRDLLESSDGMGLTQAEQEAFLGSVSLTATEKQVALQMLNNPEESENAALELRSKLNEEYQQLESSGLNPEDINLLYSKRAKGYFPLPLLTARDVEAACSVVKDLNPRSMIWRLVGTAQWVEFENEDIAKEWIDWGKLHAMNSNPVEWARVASSFRKAKYIDLSMEALNISFQLGESSKAWFEKALLLRAKKEDFVEIEAALRQSINLDSENIQSWVVLGDFQASDMQQYETAAEAYKKALSIRPSSTIWLRLALLQSQKLQLFDDAVGSFKEYISLNSSDSRAYASLGNLLYKQLEKYDEAIVAYRKAVDIDPKHAFVWNSLGVIYADKLNRFEDAESAFRMAIELEPQDAGYVHNLGLLLSHLPNRLYEAIELYKKAAELSPNDAEGWNSLGYLLSRNSIELDVAEAAYRKANAIEPTNIIYISNLATILSMDPRHYEEAEFLFRKATEQEPFAEDVWNDLGVFLADKVEKYEEAEKVFRHGLEVDKNSANIWNNLAVLLTDKLERHEEAELAFIKATELNPNSYETWRNLGALLAGPGMLDRKKDAESALRKAIALNPHDPSIWSMLGYLLEGMEEFDNAEEVYKQAETSNPDSGERWKNRYLNARVNRHILETLQALESGNLVKAKEALSAILDNQFDIATALVSEEFVELFLAPTLKDKKLASLILEMLLELGYSKYAYPLLLAFEALIKNQPDMLDNVEPETKNAAKNMFERLTSVLKD